MLNCQRCAFKPLRLPLFSGPIPTLLLSDGAQVGLWEAHRSVASWVDLRPTGITSVGGGSAEVVVIVVIDHLHWSAEGVPSIGHGDVEPVVVVVVEPVVIVIIVEAVVIVVEAVVVVVESVVVVVVDESVVVVETLALVEVVSLGQGGGGREGEQQQTAIGLKWNKPHR